MEIELNTESAVPVYEQIVQRITRGVLSGELPPGYSLPSIRQLASDLELNHNTVAKAYRLLESQHIILTAGRKGTFIHEKAAGNLKKNARQEAEFQLEELVASFREKGMAVSAIRELFEKQLSQLQES